LRVRNKCLAVGLWTIQGNNPRGWQVDKMVVKASKKPAFWLFILGLSIAFILAIPSISSDSVLNYYNQFSFNGDVNNTETSWSSWSSSSKPDDPACSSPLKVYMYELPRKYNMGMLKKDGTSQELPWTSPVVPTWTQQATNRQHSVEYWMMAYLLDGWDRQDGKHTAVRVKDPEQADVFFVPFFSSVSLNHYGKTEHDQQNQVRSHSLAVSRFILVVGLCSCLYPRGETSNGLTM